MPNETPSIELHTSFLGAFIYLFLKFCCFSQRLLAKLFWWIFVKPIFLLAKRLDAENLMGEKQRSENFVVLDSVRIIHRLLWVYLKFTFKSISTISDLVSTFSFYQHLLRWNKNIPLIGYIHEKPGASTVGLLLDYKQDGRSRGFDSTSLSLQKRYGKFQIISKELDLNKSQEEVVLRCIWMEGSDVGKTFVVRKLRGQENEPSVIIPNSIYYPLDL